MSHLRAVVRLLLLAALTGGAWARLLVGGAAQRGRAAMAGQSTSIGPWRVRVFQNWARSVARVIGMRLEVSGTAPRPPFLLVCNHLGYVDVVVLAATLPCTFVAKSDVRGWPLVGRACAAVGTLFIDRGSKRDIPRVMDEIDRIVSDGGGVVIFPEGTSTSGESVERFRPSLLDGAARSRRPVCWAGLAYEAPAGHPPARDSICWWGDMTFAGHLYHLLRLPGFRARLSFGEQPIVADDRKELATRLQDAVTRQVRVAG